MVSNGEYFNTKSAIDQYFTNYIYDSTSTTTPSVLQSMLVGKKVLLLPAKMMGASSSIIAAHASVIQTFVQNGGTLIVCDEGSTLDDLGIFNTTYQGFLTSGNVNVVNTTTPLSNGIPSIISAPQYTLYRTISNTNKINVVKYNSLYDVVTYLPFGSGKAIHIGYTYSNYGTDQAKIIANAVQWGMGNGANGGNLSIYPANGTTSSGATDTVNISISSAGMSGGLDTLYIIVNTTTQVIQRIVFLST